MSAFERIFNNAGNVRKEAYLDKMTHFDFKCLLPALLHVEDRMSMAHGLESRVPLLDHPLVEFVATVPADVKFAGGQTKHLLKQAFADKLPSQVLHRRDKMGFPVPLKEWFGAELKEFVQDLFRTKAARSRQFLHADAVLANFDKAGRFSRKAWGLIGLEIWHQLFHDRAAEIRSPGRDPERGPRRGRTTSVTSGACLMKVLVTGGCGQVGSHVAEDLLDEGASVLAVDNFATGRPEHLSAHPKLTFVEGTIANPDMMMRLCADFRPDVIVHTAASYKDPNDWYSDALTNVVGMTNLTRAAKEYAARRFDLFPDRAVLRHQTAPVADPTGPSKEPGQFLLRDLEDRGGGLSGTVRSRLRDVPACQCHRPAQRLRSAANFLPAAF